MNKPKFEDFKFPRCETELDRYVEYAYSLEEYCDELEREVETIRNSFAESYAQHLEELVDINEKRVEELQIALEEEKRKVRCKVTFPEEKIKEIKEECVAYIERETKKFAKALDKACSILSSNNKKFECSIMTLNKEGLECDVEWSKKKWKEYLLNE